MFRFASVQLPKNVPGSAHCVTLDVEPVAVAGAAQGLLQRNASFVHPICGCRTLFARRENSSRCKKVMTPLAMKPACFMAGTGLCVGVDRQIALSFQRSRRALFSRASHCRPRELWEHFGMNSEANVFSESGRMLRPGDRIRMNALARFRERRIPPVMRYPRVCCISAICGDMRTSRHRRSPRKRV